MLVKSLCRLRMAFTIVLNARKIIAFIVLRGELENRKIDIKNRRIELTILNFIKVITNEVLIY